MASLKQVWQELVDPGKDARKQYDNTLQSQIKTAETDRQNFATNAKNLSNQNTGYLNAYLSSLYQLPQLNFTSGLSQLQRGIANSNNQINKTLANRGITSGVDVKALANNQSLLAKGISQLQGQMYKDNAEVNGLGYDATMKNNANSFDMMRAAYNYNPGSNYMTLYLNQLQSEGQQQGILPQLVGTVANAYMGNWAGALGNAAGMAKTASNNQSLKNGSSLFPTGEFVDGNVNSYKLNYPTFINQMTPSNTGVSGDYINRYNYMFNRG